MSVTEHPAFIAPSNLDVNIWRYMDFTKFVYMLEQAGLFFPRLDRLGDSFEGSSTYAEVRSREKWWVGVGPPGQVRAAQKMAPQLLKWQRQWTYISCWHMNDLESAAMWRLYSRTDEAICIQSTYRRLLDSLNRHPDSENEQVFIGQVTYIDFKNDDQPAADSLLNAVMHKRKSFEHERELRAVIQRRPSSKNGPLRLPASPLSEDYPNDLPKEGIIITLDIEQLVEKVHVAPSSPSWFRELVEKVVLRHKMETEVKRSELDADPLY